MDERARGIILRTRPLTESSLIVHWLTQDHGRLATVAKGARRPKSPFLGKLDLFYEAELSFQRSRRSELHQLREVSLRHTHAALREELGRVRQAAYFAVLVEQATETETPLPEIFELFQEAVAALESSPPGPGLVFSFELKLLQHLGYDPRLETLRPESRTLASTLLEESFAAGSPSGHSKTALQDLNRFLRLSLGTALERLPAHRERALAEFNL